MFLSSNTLLSHVCLALQQFLEQLSDIFRLETNIRVVDFESFIVDRIQVILFIVLLFYFVKRSFCRTFFQVDLIMANLLFLMDTLLVGTTDHALYRSY